MLKSLAALFLISVLSFNWYGFDLLVNILETHYDQELEKALDENDYDTTQIIELDAKVILPYVADMTDFERIDGEVMINGVYYKFVERKYENGRIIYRCIPNTNKIKLHHARSTFIELMNEIQAAPENHKQTSNSLSVKKTISDYELQHYSKLICSFHELFSAARKITSITNTVAYYSITSPPPELV
ncbi:hypothetical protein SAMN05421813_1204 [Daejeonella rubra]|uniref:Uncharacterized protein n=1 Tax=Daejeonella rubra TaxID=990371 RepID=A0A1G9VBB1_9SPHI|nr:hypothetical protein [Daejeonella rubra]SDM69363.1 hypothetical protein SAMN05421813_1204 [Daejeonella rubra]